MIISDKKNPVAYLDLYLNGQVLTRVTSHKHLGKTLTKKYDMKSAYVHRVGYPTTNAFCIYVGYVFASVICFIFCKHEVHSNIDAIIKKMHGQ